MQEVKQSHQSNKQRLFLQLHPDLLSFLNELQIDCKITLSYRAKISQQGSLENTAFHNILTTLVIKKQFLLEYDVDTENIISGIKFNEHVKYGIIENAPESTTAIGMAEGIEFQFPDLYSQKEMTLFLTDKESPDQQRQFRQFVGHLEKKMLIQTKFHEKFLADRTVGKGNSVVVIYSFNKMTRRYLAVKSFKKATYFLMDGGNGKQSCRYLTQLQGIYESPNTIYIAMQYLNSTLFKYLKMFGPFFDSKKGKIFMYQLLIGLRAFHRRGIMHRDIKLDNIMVRGRDLVEPVIIDFGFAEYQKQVDPIYKTCGTTAYTAPEVLNCRVGENQQYIRYNSKCDIFSMGVVFHDMFFGRSVFEGQNEASVRLANSICDIDYQFSRFGNVSESIKDLLRKMLAKEPQNRATVEQLMLHPYFHEEELMFRDQVIKLDSYIEKDNTYRQKLRIVESIRPEVAEQEGYTQKMSVVAEKSLSNSKSAIFMNKENLISRSFENLKDIRSSFSQRTSDPNLKYQSYQQAKFQCENQIITKEKQQKRRSRSSVKVKVEKKFKSQSHIGDYK